MSIRTAEQLQEALDRDLSWRKKELTSIITEILPNLKLKGTFPINTPIRIGIALLYAHWEGFIKSSSNKYLEFIALRRLKYNELKSNFIALAVNKKLNKNDLSQGAFFPVKIVDFIINEGTQDARIPYKDVIQTSNLDSKVLKKILTVLGLDYSQYELKANLIDIELLKRRNNIAHGRFILDDIDEQNFLNLYREIITTINNFNDQILEAAIYENYRR